MSAKGLKPETLAKFMYKTPTGGHHVTLAAEQGLGSLFVVDSWERTVLELGGGTGQPDHVNDLLSAAQQHCDSMSEPIRFQVQWQAADNRALKTLFHSTVPTDSDASTAAPAGPMSADRIVSELLGALKDKDKAINSTIASAGVVLQAYERALSMQQKTIDALASLVEKQTAAAPVAPMPPELLAAELESKRLSQIAFGKLIDLGPDIGRMLLTAAAHHFKLIPASAAEGLNGSGAAHAAATVVAAGTETAQ